MDKMNLKNGQEVIVREAKEEDAASMISFYNLVAGETDFLSFGRDEFHKDLNEYKKYIKTTYEENNSIILLAFIDGKIVGIASINSNQKVRSRHVGTLGIVISEKCCGVGLGKILMDKLVIWGKMNKVTKKITLVTREDNYGAIALYKKVGFEKEGTLKKDNYINGVYYNTLVMSLFI